MILAHAAIAPVLPSQVWQSWNWDPAVILPLELAAWAYGLGISRLWAKGRGRGVAVRRVTSFYGGLFAVAIALVSPLDALGATLFSAHMVQHLVLILVAAPLLVYGTALVPTMVALPRGLRRTLHSFGRMRAVAALWAVATAPAIAWALHTMALWVWHLPSLYEAALGNTFIHALEHVSFLATAMLFWALVMDTTKLHRMPHGGRVLFVFVTALQGGGLGAILAFATSPLYPAHAAGAASWGLTALEDQQLAGVIMWIPAGTIYVITMCILFIRWLKDMDRQMKLIDSETAPAVAGLGDRGQQW